MSLVRVKPKFQVTIPTAVREAISLEVGDLLDAEVHADRIVLTPKTVVDKRLQKSLAEARQGKVLGPFRSAKAAVNALKRKPGA